MQVMLHRTNGSTPTRWTAKRAMAKAGRNGDAAMGQIFTFALEHLCLIDKKRPMRLVVGQHFCVPGKIHKLID
jgi:hypothetical protein